MANQTFKIGDVVWHLSGGPKMAVTEIGNGPNGQYATCQWWHSEKKYFAHDDFKVQLLTSEEPEVPGTFA